MKRSSREKFIIHPNFYPMLAAVGVRFPGVVTDSNLTVILLKLYSFFILLTQNVQNRILQHHTFLLAVKRTSAFVYVVHCRVSVACYERPDKKKKSINKNKK